jgi:hypothetical protein
LKKQDFISKGEKTMQDLSGIKKGLWLILATTSAMAIAPLNLAKADQMETENSVELIGDLDHTAPDHGPGHGWDRPPRPGYPHHPPGHGYPPPPPPHHPPGPGYPPPPPPHYPPGPGYPPPPPPSYPADEVVQAYIGQRFMGTTTLSLSQILNLAYYQNRRVEQITFTGGTYGGFGSAELIINGYPTRQIVNMGYGFREYVIFPTAYTNILGRDIYSMELLLNGDLNIDRVSVRLSRY